MHRIDTATKAVDLFGAGKHGFKDGDQALGIPATDLDAAVFNAMQEEVVGVIEAAGIALVKGDYTQLTSAIRRMITGGDFKDSVRVASTANIAALTGLLTIDGVVLVAGDRVLVKDQGTGADNGIYVAAAGAWARATDADTGAELSPGATIPVEAGTANADTQWTLTTDGTVTIGTTALTFQIKSGDASTNRKGMVQLATGVVAQGLTDALMALTPATLAAVLGAGGTAASDYVKIPYKDKSTGVLRYLIIQWGVANVAASNANTDVTLPITYPTAHFCAYGTFNGVAATSQIGASAFSTSIVRLVQSYTGGAQQVNWLSIGY